MCHDVQPYLYFKVAGAKQCEAKLVELGFGDVPLLQYLSFHLFVLVEVVRLRGADEILGWMLCY